MKSAAYGRWESKISAKDVAGSSLRLGDLTTFDGAVYWLEQRPLEKGRGVVMRYSEVQGLSECTTQSLSVRSQVHEYGGGAFGVGKKGIYCSNQVDQAVYLITNGNQKRLSADVPDKKLRFADFQEDLLRHRVICAREDHRAPGEAKNTIVAISTLGEVTEGQILLEGNDFYATPRISPDGTQLAWLSWNHPQMPWNGTELWTGEFHADGTLKNITLVAGSHTESIFQPEWSPQGVLHWISDKSGYWNLYKAPGKAIYESSFDFGKPQWFFELSTYAFVSEQQIACCYCVSGEWILGVLDCENQQFQKLHCPFTDVTGVRADGEKIFCLGASPQQSLSVLKAPAQTLRKSSEIEFGKEWISRPRSIEYQSENDQKVHAFYYAPQNPNYFGSGKPPLLVKAHGGPVSAATSGLNLSTQYWTSRGFAFLDVNYGGSSGFGRHYRERLSKNWGIVDVADCIAGARYCVEKGWVDSQQLYITGSSAGAFTALNVLAVTDIFKAGASYYGISDLKLLKNMSHKFESHDLEVLIGEDFEGRSPLSKVDRISTPIIFFQGADDTVSLPEQTQKMYQALQQKGVKSELHLYEGEGHGFRKAETIIKALEAELSFYLSTAKK